MDSESVRRELGEKIEGNRRDHQRQIEELKRELDEKVRPKLHKLDTIETSVNFMAQQIQTMTSELKEDRREERETRYKERQAELEVKKLELEQRKVDQAAVDARNAQDFKERQVAEANRQATINRVLKIIGFLVPVLIFLGQLLANRINQG